MNILSVKLLGQPAVKFNGSEIGFPYKKSEALFYYLCVNKKASRDEAMNIFWADSSEEKARKNLRNALYKIKTSINENIFTSSRAVIEFSDAFVIETDIDSIDEFNAVNTYTGDFLSSFTLKNCCDFEEWMMDKRNFYKEIYIKSLHNKINDLISISDYSSIEKYGNILIKNDPYNERTYRYLMKTHALSENYNKAVKLYYELFEILKNDLNVEPELKTKKLFREILELKNTVSSDYSDNYASLKNKVENLTDYYTMFHEAYPSLSSEMTNYFSCSNITDIESELKNIEKDLDIIDDLDTEYIKIKMEASYLAGRYYISIGEYEKGINDIQISIRLAHKLDNIIYLLSNYKQMIYYAIQTDNSELMNDYINRCFEILEKKDIIEERGIILRLQGLYFIKIGNFQKADGALNESISIFSSLSKFNNRYAVNISASYNYLGQMNKDLGNYEAAYEYFIKAINICLENSVVKGLEIFYSNVGQALYCMGKFKEAEEFIDRSLQYFDKFNAFWGRDLAEYYKALLEFKKGNNKKAKLHSQNAYALAKKLNNPNSLSLIEKIM